MKNVILVYDDQCRLCSWYSSLFTRYGLLPEDGRKAFSTLDNSLLEKMDQNRARNEIPLINTISGKVTYGLDAILTLIGERFPRTGSVARWPVIYWFLRKLYKLISFNRKVIIAKKCGPGEIDCTPDTNYTYRFIFLLAGLTFNTLMLFPLYTHVFSTLNDSLTIITLQSAHFSLAGMNCMLALTVNKQKAFEFLGQVNMLAIIAILLLTPLLFIHLWTDMSESFIKIYLFASTVIVVKEYLRRMQFAGILLGNKWIVSINFVSLIAFMFFIFH